jgi:hypothetical protein
MLPARDVDAGARRAYRNAMDSGRLRRRTIALVAAYAMALQALFAAFAPIDARSGAVAVLCSHDSGDGSGQPASHDLPCAAICAAMGHGIAGAALPDIVGAFALPQAIAAAVPVSEWVPPQIALTDIHAPRGPPFA